MCQYREDSGWGLNRVSQVDKLTNQNYASSDFHYTYEDREVNIYIIGTSTGVFHAWGEITILSEAGCRITHEDFEGRAKYGYADPNLDVCKPTLRRFIPYSCF